MKNPYSSIVIVIVALFVFASLAVAGPVPTWDKQINGPGRFKTLSQFNDEAVFDKETGLVWEQSPGNTDGDGDVDNDDKVTWASARQHCASKNVGGRKGWRLPSFAELASLVDPNNPGGDPDLPPGHPFLNVQSSLYWSATTSAVSTGTAWVVDFNDDSHLSVKVGTNRVRAPRGSWTSTMATWAPTIRPPLKVSSGVCAVA